MVRTRGRILVLISTNSVQRSSRPLDSAPWSGEPNPTGLWAPVAPALYRGGGGCRGTHVKKESCPLAHLRDSTDQGGAGSDRKPAAPVPRHRRPCTAASSSPHHAGLDLERLRRTTSSTAAPWTSARYFPQQKVSFPLDLLLSNPIVLTIVSEPL